MSMYVNETDIPSSSRVGKWKERLEAIQEGSAEVLNTLEHNSNKIRAILKSYQKKGLFKFYRVIQRKDKVYILNPTPV